MRSSNTCANISMKIFIKKYIVAPPWVILEFRGTAIERSRPVAAQLKYRGQTARDLVGDLIQSHHHPGTRRTFNAQAVSVMGVMRAQSVDKNVIHWHPHWTAPVGITAKHTGMRLRRLISRVKGA